MSSRTFSRARIPRSCPRVEIGRNSRRWPFRRIPAAFRKNVRGFPPDRVRDFSGNTAQPENSTCSRSSGTSSRRGRSPSPGRRRAPRRPTAHNGVSPSRCRCRFRLTGAVTRPRHLSRGRAPPVSRPPPSGPSVRGIRTGFSGAAHGSTGDARRRSACGEAVKPQVESGAPGMPNDRGGGRGWPELVLAHAGGSHARTPARAGGGPEPVRECPSRSLAGQSCRSRADRRGRRRRRPGASSGESGARPLTCGDVGPHTPPGTPTARPLEADGPWDRWVILGSNQ
jgi:hypothetical protein